MFFERAIEFVITSKNYYAHSDLYRNDVHINNTLRVNTSQNFIAILNSFSLHHRGISRTKIVEQSFERIDMRLIDVIK